MQSLATLVFFRRKKWSPSSAVLEACRDGPWLGVSALEGVGVGSAVVGKHPSGKNPFPGNITTKLKQKMFGVVESVAKDIPNSPAQV